MRIQAPSDSELLEKVMFFTWLGVVRSESIFRVSGCSIMQACLCTWCWRLGQHGAQFFLGILDVSLPLICTMLGRGRAHRYSLLFPRRWPCSNSKPCCRAGTPASPFRLPNRMHPYTCRWEFKEFCLHQLHVCSRTVSQDAACNTPECS